MTGGRPGPGYRLANLPENEDVEAGASVALAAGGVTVDSATQAAMIWSISASCSAVKAVAPVSRSVAKVSSPVAIGRSVTAGQQMKKENFVARGVYRSATAAS